MPELSSDVMQDWIGDPQGLQKALNEALSPYEEKVSDFKIWKTIKLGTGLKNAKDFRKALKKSKMRIGDWGNDILGQSAFTASDTEKDIDLVNISVAELGFKGGATRKDIYDRALELGLRLCPAEVGPQLRLQYADQPKGEWLRVAMEPISDSDGGLVVFVVEHVGGELWLDGGRGHPDYFCLGVVRFVFLRSK